MTMETEEIAARWLLKREEADWSAGDQAQLDAWLDAAPEHKVAFWRLEYGWGQADRVGALGKAPIGKAPVNKVSVVKAPVRNRPMWMMAAAASIAVVAVSGAGLWASSQWQKTYDTSVGEERTIALLDGSKIELNTQTHLRTKVDHNARAVWLDSGEAYFEVAHDPKHPFVVHAGTQTVTVLGTKFSVRRDGDHVQVAVVEGRVRVAGPANATTLAPVITRGDIAIADPASTLLVQNSVNRVNDSLSWRDGRLTFDQVTLGDAAREFNRYNRKKLVIADSQTAAIRIGGSFQATNIDAFARLLKEGFGLRVADNGENVTVSE